MKLILLISLLFGLMSTQAQNIQISPEVINTAGWHYEGQTIMLTHSIGETVIETLSTDSLILTQGFLQSGKSFDTLTSIDPFLELSLTIYPNPTSQELFVKGALTGEEKLSIYDMRGRVVLQQQLRLGEAISVRHFPSGMYQLFIIHPKTGGWYSAKLEKR
ncbi:MAG: T9SS type A sorting domain-containing protein [Bacteroidota bacterium]